MLTVEHAASFKDLSRVLKHGVGESVPLRAAVLYGAKIIPHLIKKIMVANDFFKSSSEAVEFIEECQKFLCLAKFS